MNANLVEARVVPPAEQYIRDRLADGNALSKALLKLLPIERGQIITCLPPGVVPQSLQDFSTGGKLPTPHTSEWKAAESRGESLLMIPVPSTSAWITSKIREYLREESDHLCVLEDALARPTDPALRKRATRHTVHGDEVYHILLSQDAQYERVEATLRAATSTLPLIGILSTSEETRSGDSLGTLSTVLLEALASRAQKILVGAYDGEGYLVWER